MFAPTAADLRAARPAAGRVPAADLAAACGVGCCRPAVRPRAAAGYAEATVECEPAYEGELRRPRRVGACGNKLLIDDAALCWFCDC